jgi:gamma-glutamylcyclotransferase (GGCT)/AIG2-like uncharacterized protein YtfP
MMKVFVYGTLRRGEANHSLLEKATCIAEQCWTSGLLYDTSFGYPAMKPTQSLRVYGELYAVSEYELARLDQLEGYTEGGNQNLYERIHQTVSTDKGQCEAFVYVANREELLKRKINYGDWKEHMLLSSQRTSVFYFAYGSCMDHHRFQEDGYDHYFQNMLGVGVLPNYSLRFTYQSLRDAMGRADIVEEGGKVEGKVYDIPIQALKEYLYRREGVPNAYRPTFITVDLNGSKVEALTFVVTTKNAEIAPPEWYEEEILRGAEGFVSMEYLNKVRRHINSLK